MLSDDDYASSGEDDHRHQADTRVRDPEEWADYWSEELVTMYHSLQEQASQLGAYVLDTCAFPDFVEFCHRFSSGRKPPC